MTRWLFLLVILSFALPVSAAQRERVKVHWVYAVHPDHDHKRIYLGLGRVRVSEGLIMAGVSQCAMDFRNFLTIEHAIRYPVEIYTGEMLTRSEAENTLAEFTRNSGYEPVRTRFFCTRSDTDD